MNVSCSALRSLESHVGAERWRAAPGGESRDSTRRRAAGGGQRKAPGCERGTAQGARTCLLQNLQQTVQRALSAPSRSGGNTLCENDAGSVGPKHVRIRACRHEGGRGAFKFRASGRASMPANSARAALCCASAEPAACGIAELEYGHPLDCRVLVTYT
eukprot:1177588-Pleurochrysis_carterae.AAC.2